MSFPIVFSEFALESFADIKTQINTRWGYAVVVEFELTVVLNYLHS